MSVTFLRPVCPRCGRAILCSPADTQPPQCDAPSCGYEFPPVERERELPAREGEKPEPTPVTVPAVVEALAPSAPLLVVPHLCPRCQAEIRQPAGVRRSTITHDCGNRTDLFAVLFHAPCCGAFVEMPRARAGQVLNCPACRRTFNGPRDDLLHRLAGDVRAGEVLRFRCTVPECRQRLQCNTHIDGVPTPGLDVVCPKCLHVLQVPSAGDAVTRSPSSRP